MTKIIISIVIALFCGVASNWIYYRFFQRDKTAEEHQANRYSRQDWRTIAIVLFISAILYFNESVWIVPLKWQIVIVCAGFLYALLLLFLFSFSNMAAWQEHLLLIGLPALALWAGITFLPRNIYIDCPTYVSDQAEIRGRVQNQNWNVNLLVLPHGCSEWLVQKVPTPDRFGLWYVNAQFGGQSGQRFDIMAIASPDNDNFGEGEALAPNGIPQTFFRSKIHQSQKR